MDNPIKGLTGRNTSEPASYEIHVRERIDPRWTAWFEGMTINPAENGATVISGTFTDKSALYGLLAMIGELNLTLLSVRELESPNPTTGGNHEK